MILEISDLIAGYGDHRVLHDLKLHIGRGSFIGIIGPNGSGKSTLMQVLARSLNPESGVLLLCGEDLYSLTFWDFGKKVGFVPQESAIPFAYPVYEVVMMGRNPHIPRFRQPSQDDHDRVRQALYMTGTDHLADRSVTSLSGGERQRVMIARILAQDTDLLLLDEPFAHIDLRHQFDLIRLIRETSRGRKTVIGVFHDINLAAAYCDHLILLNKGEIRASGSPREILQDPALSEVFQISPVLGENPVTGTPHLYLSDGIIGSVNRSTHIHLISGGGSGIPVITMLVSEGYRPVCGILSEQDSDCMIARYHGLTVFSEPPFTHISIESEENLLEEVQKADRIIVTEMPVGWGNFPNLRVLQHVDATRIILYLPRTDPVIPDFTSGAAIRVIHDLVAAGAVRVRTVKEIQTLLSSEEEILK